MGAIDYHRGIETVIRALPVIKNEVPDVHLLIVGQGSTAESLKELANELGVLDRITFEGHVSESKVPSYCKASDIGLIPHLKSEQTDNSCPNKIFQYMATRLPVLTNDCRSLARLVRETGSGVVYKADDPVDMAKQVVRLYASPAEREKMGLNGSEAVKKTYHYERQVAELVNFYHELSKKIKE
jgi:glycosyltransferase involved in cell wall biosynthesis